MTKHFKILINWNCDKILMNKSKDFQALNNFEIYENFPNYFPRNLIKNARHILQFLHKQQSKFTGIQFHL